MFLNLALAVHTIKRPETLYFMNYYRKNFGLSTGPNRQGGKRKRKKRGLNIT